MSTAEILEELPKLPRSQREEVWRRLEELELAEIEDPPEMLAAIDAARQSICDGKAHTVDHARELIAQWTVKSS